jgi:hypothetical protein
MGKKLEPVIAPLGYDWKIGIALITSFAAREVFVGTMATLYSVDGDEIAPVRARMAQEINPDTGKAAEITYIHSISGGLAVGNCDDFFDGQVAGHAFIYDTVTGLQTNINYPGTGKSNSAYGIWSNSSSSYTIAGGVGSVGISEGDGRDGDPLGKATLIDYDSITGKFSHYQTYSFTKKTLLPKTLRRQVIVTHFEGIWTDGQGLYKLPATIATEDGQLAVGALATVKRNRDGSFGKAAWSVFDIPGTSLSTNDSVFGDANVGLATYSNGGGTSDYAGLVL